MEEAAKPVEEQAAADDAPKPTGEESAEQDMPLQGQEDVDKSDQEDSQQQEDSTAIGPKELTDLLDGKPELKAILDADPALKGKLYQMGRFAAETNEFREIVGSPEEARVIAAAGGAYHGIGDRLSAIDMTAAEKGDYSTFDAFVDDLVAQTQLRDEEGNVLLDDKGQPRTDGTVGRMFKTFFLQRLDLLALQAKNNNDDEALAAIDTLMDRAKLRPSSRANQEDWSEEQREQQRQLDERDAAVNNREAAQRESAKTAYLTAINSATNTETETAIGKILSAATGLDADNRKAAEREIRTALKEAIGKSQYRNELRKLETLPYGPAREQKHRALASQYLNRYLGRVAPAIIERFGAVVQTKEEQRKQQQAASAEASRSEARGSMSAAPTTSSTDANSSRAIRDELKQTLGREPSTEEIILEKGRRAFSGAGAR